MLSSQAAVKNDAPNNILIWCNVIIALNQISFPVYQGLLLMGLALQLVSVNSFSPVSQQLRLILINLPVGKLNIFSPN